MSAGSRRGRLIRRLLIRPGHTWVVPTGVARGVRLKVEAEAPLHTYLGTAEIELLGRLRGWLVPGLVCFDIGANDGYYSLGLARRGATVLAFECDPARLRAMQANLELNPQLARRIALHAVAIGSDGPDAGARCQARQVSLDGIIAAGLPVPDLLKIDVEGAEAEVLEGAARLLCTRQPHVLVETHARGLEQSCRRHLLAAGYRPEAVDQRRWLRENRPGAHNRWLLAAGRRGLGEGRAPAR